MAVFWIVAPHSLVEVCRSFGGACCLHHHGATTQKTVIFILAAVRTSNLTYNVQPRCLPYCSTAEFVFGCRMIVDCREKLLSFEWAYFCLLLWHVMTELKHMALLTSQAIAVNLDSNFRNAKADLSQIPWNRLRLEKLILHSWLRPPFIKPKCHYRAQ
jgi:hypothetical protein